MTLYSFLDPLSWWQNFSIQLLSWRHLKDHFLPEGKSWFWWSPKQNLTNIDSSSLMLQISYSHLYVNTLIREQRPESDRIVFHLFCRCVCVVCSVVDMLLCFALTTVKSDKKYMPFHIYIKMDAFDFESIMPKELWYHYPFIIFQTLSLVSYPSRWCY